MLGGWKWGGREEGGEGRERGEGEGRLRTLILLGIAICLA